MIFQLGSLIVELDSPAQYPLTPDIELVQAMEESASGITHVEDFSVQKNTITYNFIDISDADYQAILSWFINVAEGMMNPFSLTDDFGSTSVVRFTTPRISFPKNNFGLRDGSFTVKETT